MKKINKRRLKYGANNTILIAAAIVIFILVNLLAAALSEKFPATRIDLTGNGLYEIGDATRGVLAELDASGDEVTIYYMKDSGEEDVYVKEVLLKYLAASDNLKCQDVYYVRDPGFVKRFSDIDSVSEHSLIIEDSTTNRHRLINYIDMFEISSNASTGQRYPSAAILESGLTNALAYCISEEETVVCFTTDHGEPNPGQMATILSGENITATSFSLKTADVPEECRMLYIISPIYDFTAEEIERLDDYLDRGGSVQLAVEPVVDLPRLEAYLAEWGVTLDNNYVVEGNPSYMVVEDGSVFLPRSVESAFTSDIISSNIPVFATLCRSISFEQDLLGAITKSTVFYTSRYATAYDVIYDEEGNIEESDNDGAQGVFDLAVYLEKTVGENYDKTARFLVSGSSSFWGVSSFFEFPVSLSDSSYGNNRFFVNSSYEMLGLNSTKLTIGGKSLGSTSLVMTVTQQVMYRIIFCFALPLIILVGGIIIWLRRRHL